MRASAAVWLFGVAAGCTFAPGAVPGEGAPDAPAPPDGAQGDDGARRDGTAPDAVAFDASPCGNGALDPGEACDDGGAAAGDGCDAACQIEPAWRCPTPGSPCTRVTGVTTVPGDLLPATGGVGGTGFARPCGAGQVVVGFEGYQSYGLTFIGRMRSLCATVVFAADGRLAWTGVMPTMAVGTEMGIMLPRTSCAGDEAAVGFTGNGIGLVSGLQLHCASLAHTGGALVLGTPRTLTTFGPAVETWWPPAQCPPGQAAIAFEGRSGSLIDQMTLRCGALVPAP